MFARNMIQKQKTSTELVHNIISVLMAIFQVYLVVPKTVSTKMFRDY